jgi:hypothetical protein
MHKGSRQHEAEWLYASPGIPPSTFAVNLKLSISKLTENTMETRNLSIAIWFWLIHRGGGGRRWLVLRGSAARREQQHQSYGDKKSACRDFVHLSLPDFGCYWKFTLLKIRRRCRCLTASITHTNPFACTQPAQHPISMPGYQSSRHGAVCQYDDARWTRAPSGAVADRDQIHVTRVADHGYPWLIYRLTYRGTNHRDLHARSYKEEGARGRPMVR